ncbi:hypothetical protein GPECTOR_226g497 [Gonium pectorale]|uniref:Uncharacterized protein n=1 Tax=Gonium pectorale TaxID=33097 RepID=A0A150FWL3_GONPE|nr:hypothetical protein GPECTOR_226g497 [Gonium pectorale]|eukprot:KXZ42002.1 hypothetical protein GPECTOR_226g497 [Gonium pectorale]
MNPAFDNGAEEGTADLGLDLGESLGLAGAGRPDSSAWWQTAPLSAEQQGAAAWQQGSIFAAAAPSAAATRASPNRSDAPAGANSSLRGAQSRHTVKGPAAPAPRAPAQNPFLVQVPAPTASAHATRAAAAAMAAAAPLRPAAGTGAGSSSAQSPTPLFAPRELDEWSFSRFFGPGKTPLEGRGLGASEGQYSEDRRDNAAFASELDAEPDAEQQVAGDAAEDGMEAEPGRDWGLARQEAGGAELERDGPAPDQDRRAGAQPRGSHAEAAAAGLFGPPGQVPPQQQLLRREGGHVGVEASEGPWQGSTGQGSGVGYVEAELRTKLGALEAETQQQLRQLQERLAAAEEELDKCK